MAYFIQGTSWQQWLFTLYTNIRAAVSASIEGQITSIFTHLPNLLAAIIVAIAFWLMAKFVRKAFLGATRRAKLDLRLRLLFSRLLVVLVYVVGIFGILSILIPSFDFGSVVAGLGFTSFVIGFAAKDIVNNFISGVLILWQRPFHIGDYIFVGSNQGKVEYIGVRATTLRKDDGELILIPNGDMYSSALTIRAAGTKRRMQLGFSIDYDSDVELAKSSILEAIRGIPGLMEEPAPNTLVSELTADGIRMTTNFWIDTNENKPLQVFDRAAFAIMQALGKAGVQLFPPGTMIVDQAKTETPGGPSAN
jgi:small conductance mechanosensitive channel